MQLRTYLDPLPLIAILRGVLPDEAVAVSEALVEAGLRIIEVPLNSPEPLRSIEQLSARWEEEVLIGAGTVLRSEDVLRVHDAGGKLIVMPHGNPEIIEQAKRLGLACTPGVATPTEGFAALAAGADALKLFPAEILGPPALRAWRAVFPSDTLFLPVGGITPQNMRAYIDAGASGFGIGSALFKPGMERSEIRANAERFRQGF